jgi:hypothetical protein
VINVKHPNTPAPRRRFRSCPLCKGGHWLSIICQLCGNGSVNVLENGRLELAFGMTIPPPSSKQQSGLLGEASILLSAADIMASEPGQPAVAVLRERAKALVGIAGGIPV